MNTVKNNNKKMQKKTSVNPFVKAWEDKRKIVSAVQNGKSLSTLKGIKFVRPI